MSAQGSTMSNVEYGKSFLVGLLVGAGVGLAAAVLLTVQRRPLFRVSPLERARDRADRVRSGAPDAPPRKEGRERRAGRTLDRQIDRMRSAGF